MLSCALKGPWLALRCLRDFRNGVTLCWARFKKQKLSPASALGPSGNWSHFCFPNAFPNVNWGRCSGSSPPKLTPNKCSSSAKGVGDVCVSSSNNDVVAVKDKLKTSSKVAAHGYLHNNIFFCCFILPFTVWFGHSCCSRHYTPFEVWSVFPAEIQVSCSGYILKRLNFTTIPHQKQDMRSANLLKSI